MANYNNRLDEILCLTSERNSILEVEIGDDSNYFFTNDFEPPAIGSVTSNPYLTFTAIDITNFIVNSDYNLNSRVMFLERFGKIIREGQIVEYKFSDNHKWRFYN